ncbi:MAG: transketolase [Deltaproteobacteria bacterium]|nr:transketolase [Deltaproteobacteria bacterium]
MDNHASYPPEQFRLAANSLRFLAIDQIEQARSGHPGAPMGMAEIATVLWGQFLRFSPDNPAWLDRDRFVLSNGHASTLLYSLLHLTGYDLPLEELRNFRQLGSKTAGHPEYRHAPGVEMTTGPLGQGISTAVGMALAERNLAARFNRDKHEIINHYTYVFAGDGDLMEGVSHEACSLAGHLGLGRLIVLFDDNGICIDGKTSMTISEKAVERFAAYGWHVESVDGHDPAAISGAIQAARHDDRPSLIACRTTIGRGAPNKGGTADTHGSPLGPDETAATRKNLDWQWGPFEVPLEAREYWKNSAETGRAREKDWQARLDAYCQDYPQEGAELRRVSEGRPSAAWEKPLADLLQSWLQDPPAGDATRSASGKALEAFAMSHPDLLGGSADLTPSNNTHVKAYQDISPGEYSGRYIRYGVREHAMGALMNGMALHGGVVPYGGTFLVFSDYMRPAVRLAALMGVQVVYVFTHDSIGLGEDGPTHQPVEHFAALRAIPGLRVYRPGDPRETLEAWADALRHTAGPSALLLTRQKIPTLEGTGQGGLARGGYVLADAPEGLELKTLLLATGSELHLALEARQTLAAEGIGARVVSLPCWETFEEQDRTYRDEVIPPAVACRVAVEAGVSLGWERYTGSAGAVVGMSGFGASAPAGELFEKFGITAAAVADQAKKLLRG